MEERRAEVGMKENYYSVKIDNSTDCLERRNNEDSHQKYEGVLFMLVSVMINGEIIGQNHSSERKKRDGYKLHQI